MNLCQNEYFWHISICVWKYSNLILKICQKRFKNYLQIDAFYNNYFEKYIEFKVVQALMGHQHYSTTIEIYTHVTEQEFDDEIAKFGSAVV